MMEYCKNYGASRNIRIALYPFVSGEAFLQNLHGDMYDVVFMDIFMTGISGVETARQLPSKDHACILIFLTSSADFMPNAFSAHAFEYLLKPFTQERVYQVLADAMKLIPASAKYVDIVSERKTQRILPADVLAAISARHDLDIVLQDGRVLYPRMKAMDFLAQAGHDMRFLSINKGVIVNMDYITSIKDRSCTMKNGEKYPIRIRECAKIEQLVQNYAFKKI